MRVKSVIHEDITNYKKCSMFIGTITCNGKCWRENNLADCICQNTNMMKEPTFTINDSDLIKMYIDNGLTSAIVFGGLEPFDQFDELFSFISTLRREYGCDDDVVIYTGYNSDEIRQQTILLATNFRNIIVKFGRYIPNVEGVFDETLGVQLASNNQHAFRLEWLIADAVDTPIKFLDDPEWVANIQERIKLNDGYCPCNINKTPETKCICQEFLEQESGTCRCGIFTKY